MIMLVTGNGKGKTTSSLGQALRVLGEGKKAIMLQFIKGPWITGEDKAAKLLEPNFSIVKGGRGFVGILGDSLPRSEHKKAAEATLKLAEEKITSGEYALVVLDEINVALDLKLISTLQVTKLLKRVPDTVMVMLTGRDAPKALYPLADLISEVKEVKHPYAKGARARRGVEF